MKCPKCGNLDTKVIDSRVVEDNQAIRRRRECEYCKTRFTTFERRGLAELVVIKRDGTKELYDRSKLKKAAMLAFAKRKVDLNAIDVMLSNLEIERSKQGTEIDSIQIGKDLLAMLKELDPVAYVRFASVYMKFESLWDFAQLLGGKE